MDQPDNDQDSYEYRKRQEEYRRGEEARDLATRLENFVNRNDRSAYEAVADAIVYGTHRTLQQNVMRLFLTVLKKWSEALDANRYDARNEDTVRLARKILDAIKNADGLRYI